MRKRKASQSKAPPLKTIRKNGNMQTYQKITDEEAQAFTKLELMNLAY
jgi:hypothetical protein